MRYIETNFSEFDYESFMPRNGLNRIRGPKIKKMRPEGAQDEEARLWPATIIHPVPDSRPNQFLPFTEPKNTSFVGQDFPEFSGLIQTFIARNGIGSSYENVCSVGEYVNTKDQPLINNGEVVSRLTGHIFERLAYHWLEAQNNDGLYLDPGSCVRIFTKLIHQQIASHIPDGAHIDFTDGIPTIDSVAEYKAHPEAYPDNTHASIKNVQAFLQETSGKTFIFATPLVIDRTKRIEANHISVSKSPKAVLVVPANRNFKTPEDMEIIKTPFDSRFLSRVVHSVLYDLPKSK